MSDEWDNLPRVHPREARTREAENELNAFVLDLVKKHQLSEGESLRVVTSAFHSWASGVAKYMIRDERRPHPKKRTP